MKVILDTNVLLVSIPRLSQYRLIFDSLLQGKFSMAVSESILQEYEEIIAIKTNKTISNNLIELIYSLHNVELTDVYFHWNLIDLDPDDNKFVDCAIAANADYIITNDHHFQILKQIKYPITTTLSADQFLELL
ncbi:putative toxin-antitoxin system toxin component, PIN family [Algoriphagus locisalis]|uniref:Putative toxin-antitoxin system toxin component, PIN family n=1 Tax=Algoriphagus locisalis TaxID=305507 RepID=A0A1I6Z1P8_9BACT|nr:putative toxin-antitoxin system toxin component, PIN family [Algoriphagus locisalis]SFT56528.1 putative toxin-antitoxin system toxin component, PIN family [Algoriphagus locisalis]